MKTWQKCNTEIFWKEITQSDHIVQIYENDNEILDSLENFVIGGFKVQDSVIIIATESHLTSLQKRLQAQHYDLSTLESEGLYIALNAEDILSQFMSVGWPDEKLFTQTISEVVLRARGKNNRRIRAYGEMVAILWTQGYNGATIELENLWNKFCKTETLCLFCAYPKTGFTQDAHKAIGHICSMHTKTIS